MSRKKYTLHANQQQPTPRHRPYSFSPRCSVTCPGKNQFSKHVHRMISRCSIASSSSSSTSSYSSLQLLCMDLRRSRRRPLSQDSALWPAFLPSVPYIHTHRTRTPVVMTCVYLCHFLIVSLSAHFPTTFLLTNQLTRDYTTGLAAALSAAASTPVHLARSFGTRERDATKTNQANRSPAARTERT